MPSPTPAPATPEPPSPVHRCSSPTPPPPSPFLSAGVPVRNPPIPGSTRTQIPWRPPPSAATRPPLLRLPRRGRRARLLMHGCRLRDGQEWRRRRLDGSHAPGARHEVHCPRRHGWSPRYLRPHHRRHHLHRHQHQGQAIAAILPLRRLRAPLLRTRLWPRRARRWNVHRHRRRRGCQGKLTAAKVVCGHDPHPHLRGRLCTVSSWVSSSPLVLVNLVPIREGSVKRTRLMHHCIQSVPFLVKHCPGSC